MDEQNIEKNTAIDNVIPIHRNEKFMDYFYQELTLAESNWLEYVLGWVIDRVMSDEMSAGEAVKYGLTAAMKKGKYNGVRSGEGIKEKAGEERASGEVDSDRGEGF